MCHGFMNKVLLQKPLPHVSLNVMSKYIAVKRITI